MKKKRFIVCLVLLILLAPLFVNAENDLITISGRIYYDSNKNSEYDTNDSIFSNINIELTRQIKSVSYGDNIDIQEYEPVSSIKTNEAGEYEFSIRKDEIYKIVISDKEYLSSYDYDAIDVCKGIASCSYDIKLSDKTISEEKDNKAEDNDTELSDKGEGNNEVTFNSLSEKMLYYSEHINKDELSSYLLSEDSELNIAELHNYLYRYILTHDDEAVKENYIKNEQVEYYNQGNTSGRPNNLNDLNTYLVLPSGYDMNGDEIVTNEENERHFAVWYTTTTTSDNFLEYCWPNIETNKLFALDDDDTDGIINGRDPDSTYYALRDLDNNGNPDSIEYYAFLLEDLYRRLLDEYDGVNELVLHPDNDLVNIYLGTIPDYGQTHPTQIYNENNKPITASADIVIDINFRSEIDVQMTIVHELTHALIYANNYQATEAIDEAFATYSEDEIISGSAVYMGNIINDYLRNTELPINYGYVSNIDNEYGAVVFLWYMENVCGQNVVNDIMAEMANPDDLSYSYLEIINDVLIDSYNTSLSDVFAGFTSSIYDIYHTGIYDSYIEGWDSGAESVQEWHDENDNSFNKYILSFPYNRSSSVMYLSSHYYRFKPSYASSSIVTSILGQDDTGYIDAEYVVYVYLENENNGVFSIQDPIEYIASDYQNDIYITVRNINVDYTAVGVSIANPLWSDEYCFDYSINCIAHSMGPWTVTQASTCSTVGEMTRHCISGGCNYSETVGIPQNPNNHIGPFETIVISSPTCTEKGESKLKCTICNGTASTFETDALGHDFTIYQNTSYQTYSSTQHKVINQYKCSRCAEVDNIIQYASHTYNIPAATCDTAKYCTVCGHVAQAALGHSYSSATCESPATCTRCGATTGSPLGHNMGSWYTVTASTCCTYGTQRRDCSRCGYYETSSLPLDSSNHSGGSHTEVVSNPTCTASGSQREVCDGCSAVLNTSSIPALGHSMSGWSVITASTCCTPGAQSRYCTRSGCSYSENSSLPLNPNNHSGGTYWTVTTAATCTASGVRSQICYGCSTVLSTQAIPALGHSWSGWVYQYTYYDEDWQSNVHVYKRTCSRCGAVEYDYI